MSQLLDYALRYAGLGWHIFPLRRILTLPDGSKACTCKGGAACGAIGKHPAIKWSKEATCNPEVIRGWQWGRYGGIGCATGPSGLLVLDLDGIEGVATYGRLMAGAGPAMTARARTARGAHVYFRGEAPTTSDPVTKLDVRSTGGFVVLPPSPHASGHVYSWESPPWDEGQWGDGLPVEMWIAETPAAVLKYARAKKKRPAGMRPGRLGDKVRESSPEGVASGVKLPEWLACASPDFGDRLERALGEPDWAEVTRALACIPPSSKMDVWVRVGMALHEASGGADWALDMWDAWSVQSRGRPDGGGQYEGRDRLEYRWANFREKPEGVTIRYLFFTAAQHGYKKGAISEPALDNSSAGPSKKESSEAPQAAAEGGHQEEMNGHAHAEFFAQFSSESDNPLIRLNNRFAVLANHGGKCVVLEWIKSNINPSLKIPSMQTFPAFRDRYGNEYVTIKKTKHLKDGDQEYEEAVQLGGYWLRWPDRRTYQGIELNPAGPPVSEDGYLNLWRGWGCDVRKGDWSRMRSHIINVLAAGDPEAADYILRWSAWTVQNPAKPAEVALVTRGDKGAGKGLFAGSMKRIFGAHGLQIYSSKHLVGNFNAHMRACLLLFADEAYWAGDKASESVLKGLITEATYPVEQKGVDTVDWPNRLHIIMSANDDWVVPASHDERRYAVFDVSAAMVGDHFYFQQLRNEIDSGGLEAMLYDLLHMDLGSWHPRAIPQNEALRRQKMQSMQPLWEWWESIAQDGIVPAGDGSRSAAAKDLFSNFREFYPHARMNSAKFGRFLKERECEKSHKENGNYWSFPATDKMREDFEKKWGPWQW